MTDANGSVTPAREAARIEDALAELQKSNDELLALARRIDSPNRSANVEWQLRNASKLSATSSAFRNSLDGRTSAPSLKVALPRQSGVSTMGNVASLAALGPNPELRLAIAKIRAGTDRIIDSDERVVVRALPRGTPQTRPGETVEDTRRRRALGAVGAFIKDADLAPDGEGCFVTNSDKRLSEFATEYRPQLCSGTRLADRRGGAFATGTLVAPNVVLTAGHVLSPDSSPGVRRAAMSTLRFCFGFRQPDPDAPPAAKIWIRNSLIYTPIRIIASGAMDNGDWVLLELDRTVPPFNANELRGPDNDVVGHDFAQLEPMLPPRGATVYAAGHTLGATFTIDLNRRVLGHEPGHFYANLNNAVGGSGSPVFDMQHRVVGVVSRQQDLIGGTQIDGNFVRAGDCWVERFVTNPGGDVLKYFDNVVGVEAALNALNSRP